jgi:hypothetical protein
MSFRSTALVPKRCFTTFNLGIPHKAICPPEVYLRTGQGIFTELHCTVGAAVMVAQVSFTKSSRET